MNNVFKNFTLPLLALLTLGCVWSCQKVQFVDATTADVNIYDYLKQNPSQFSLFTKIVEKSGYAGFLNAYGGYTLFAPTDDGVKAYLTEVNKGSVDAFTQTEAQAIVKFHLLQDTLTTSSFKDGKLPLVTMYGQYLVTGVSYANGTSNFLINRQANLLQGNVRTGNGFVHTIDKVLKPATKSLAQLISDDPKYSIFKQALVATGYYDTLNTINGTDTLRRWMTVLAETDQALKDSGITSYDVLKQRYSNTGNPKSADDSLHIYVAYHILFDAKYLADIVSANSHTTYQPLEVVASKLDGEKVLINDIDFNGVHETGIRLDRSSSDVSSTNGVLHAALGHFRPKVRQPAPVFWDVADFPEVRKLPSVFRKASFSFAYGAVKDINWDKPANTLDYAYSSASNLPCYYNDYLSVPMGNTTRNFWIEFTSPLIVKGRYKLWICYRAAKQSGTLGQTGGSNMPCQVYFDNVATSRTVTFTEQRPNLSDGEMEALGWKKYSTDAQQFMSGKFVGIVDVPTTDRHKVRIQALPAAGTGQNANYIDMIHIIPINNNQYLPRFGRDGSIVYQ